MFVSEGPTFTWTKSQRVGAYENYGPTVSKEFASTVNLHFMFEVGRVSGELIRRARHRSDRATTSIYQLSSPIIQSSSARVALVATITTH